MKYNRRRRKKHKFKKIKKSFKRGRGLWDTFKSDFAKAWNGTIGFY